MNSRSVIWAMIRADFLERTRRSNFLITLCLVLYLGYAVNAGQILVKLDSYRGVYNSAWVGGLMTLVITFFLGLLGFYLVKDTIHRDERTGVGQIIATTPINRPQYMFGKWLSNFAVLSSLVSILAVAAIFMQLIQREAPTVELWQLIAPFLFVALPMMALVAAIAIFFESVRWLKGGFGNIVYFFLFSFIFVMGIQLANLPMLDVTGMVVIGSSMKAAVKEVFPAYGGSFVLSMISDKPLDTFVWSGVDWSIGLILQRLAWVVISAGIALAGSLFFRRFDPAHPLKTKTKRKASPDENSNSDETVPVVDTPTRAPQLTPLSPGDFHPNIMRLIWLECLLLVKGLKWYWLAGMAFLWVGSVAAPSDGFRKYWYMMAAIWPVLVWSQMGVREFRYQAEQLVAHSPYPAVRLLVSSWLAGVILTFLATSGVVLGRLLSSEPVGLLPWFLSILFIPALSLALGVWSHSSKVFEVVYPILWYLGPFNTGGGLAVLDFLSIHDQSPFITHPAWIAVVIVALLAAGYLGRRRRVTS